MPQLPLIVVAAAIAAVLPASPEIQQALALRARYGVPVRAGAETIYVHSLAVHHLRNEFSVVASRDQTGRWIVSAVGEEGPALLRAPTRMIPETVRGLSAEDGRKLDRLLADVRLYRQTPREREGPPATGAALQTMEIVGLRGTVVVRWVGRLTGRQGKVADLVLGKG